MTAPEPLATFKLQSRHLCYGALHNIYHGASVRKVPGLPAPAPQEPGGTVRRHGPDYNLPALSGTWNIYRLIWTHPENGTTHINAYFVCHSTVDPHAEVDRILRVSGSPYENDSGGQFNDENTLREGVFVLNRYDWNYYDERGKEEVQEPEPPIDQTCSAVGIVDIETAKDFVERLKLTRSDRRDLVASDGRGAWLCINNAEYCFGRFGFDEEKKHARSFLLFSTYTDFTATRFVGEGQPTLRQFESPRDRFQRRLREGFDFSQGSLIQRMFLDKRPAAADLLGPYDAEEHLLTSADIEAVREALPALNPWTLENQPPLDPEQVDDAVREALEKWSSASVDLTNEIFLSLLEYSVLPYLHSNPHPSPEAAANALFAMPQSNNEETGDMQTATYLQNRFLGNENNASSSSTVPDPEHASLKARMRQFLTARGVDADSDFLEGMCRVVFYLLKEIVELTRNCSFDSERLGHIVPYDVFLVIRNDGLWFRENLTRSKMFWCV